MTIDWKKYVDKIYIVNYVGQIDRYDALFNELHRVDISDDMIINFENINTPLYRQLMNKFKDNTWDKVFDREEEYKYAFDCTIAHYLCMKHAQQNNYKRILILENDVRFLKDKNLIKNILDKSIEVFNSDKATILIGQGNIICGTDLWTRSWIINPYYKYTESDKVYNELSKVNDLYCVVGAACTFYNIKATEQLCKYIESFTFNTIDQYNLIYDYNDTNIYYLTNQIAIQQGYIVFKDCTQYNLCKPTFKEIYEDYDYIINENTGNLLWIDNVHYYKLTQEMLDYFFDKIYIISYVKNVESRKRIIEQFTYHGITNFEFVYTYDFDSTVNSTPKEWQHKHWAASFAHYDCIKKAYELDYKRILVFEDDVVFLKDKKQFIDILIDGICNTSDIVLYDYIKLYYGEWHSVKYQSGYAVNRKGMEFYIKNFEKNKFIIDEYLYFNNNTNELANIIYQKNVPTGLDAVYLDESTLDTTVYMVPKQLCIQEYYGRKFENIENKYINNINDYLVE